MSKEGLISYSIAILLSDNYRSRYQYSDTLDNGTHFTVLHKAASIGDLETVRLLACDSNLNSSTINGKTALHYAAMYNQMEVVKLLINLGANHEIKDFNGSTVREFLTTFDSKNYFDQLILNFKQNNAEILAEKLFDILPFPQDICYLIGEYEGTSRLNEEQDSICCCTGCYIT